MLQRLARGAALAASAAFGLAIGGHVDAAGSAECKFVRVAEWQVRLAHGALLADGAINGRSARVLLDTGAMRSILQRGAAKRLGLTLRPAPKYRFNGLGGESDVDVAELDEFRIGDAVRSHWLVLAAGNDGAGIDFVLGEDFFHLVDVEFDLAHNAIRLFQPKDCERVGLAYWATEGVSVVGIEGLSDDRSAIIVPVRINGAPVKALLDSGATTTILSLREAAQLGITPQTPGVAAGARYTGIGKDLVESWISPLVTFAIGNETIRDTKLPFAQMYLDGSSNESSGHISKKGAAMLLGLDFLRAHRVLVAHSQEKVYFTYAGGPVFTPIPAPAAGVDRGPEAGGTPPAK
jgi:predicted aspartyl protease